MITVDYAWAAGVVLLASFIRSYSGFGFALVAVPLLSVRFPLVSVLPLILVFDLVIGLVLTANKWHRFRDVTLWLMLAGVFPGVYLGTRVLVSLPEAILKPVLGFGILAYALRLLFMRTPVRRTKWARTMAVVAGLASGVLGGAFGTSGPPLVMYINSYSGGDKTDFRARMLLLLFLENIWRTGTYVTEGLVTQPILTRAAMLLPLLGVGMWTGSHAHHRASDTGFQRAIAGLLILSGLVLLVKRGH